MQNIYLFAFQILITVLLTLVIIFQKSSSDGIINSKSDSSVPTNSQMSFVNKITILFIVLFIGNSLLLARNSIKRYKDNKSLISSLKDKDQIVEQNDVNVPKME